MDQETASKLSAAARIALGAAFVVEGFVALKNHGRSPLLGGERGVGETPEASKTGGIIKKAPIYTVRTIDERVAYIQKLAKKGAVDPKIIEVAKDILTQK